MSKMSIQYTVTIDNKSYKVPANFTILQAAEKNHIYIPTLCHHRDLSPHGGCRLCVVEVEGMRNFPTSCTTPVEEGMVIRTHTAQVQKVRQEILQLFMSEHPSSCLICDEKTDCQEYSITIHKAGVTTGCRYCPNDGQCELQDTIEKLEVKEINYPIFYRNLRVEKEDPFYDRDYNLCILCGRCIRMCQEVRLANVLAFKYRGRDTVIGPAYHRTHLGSGCEFCGACVSVCPTGTLAEKARKWDGKPDREQTSTCAFCGVGCQLKLQIKNDKIIGSLPADDSMVNKGQLCVKGRFCVTELVNGYQRLHKPYQNVNKTKVAISWEDAIDLAAEKLSQCKPNESAIFISPNCFNEDLYIAQKFSRLVMESHHIDTSAREFYGDTFTAYLNLFQRSVPISEIGQCATIMCIGLDTRYGRSVVSVELRKALQKGAKIITINPQDHNLTLTAEQWVQPKPGNESQIIQELLNHIKNKQKVEQSKKPIHETENLSHIAQMLEKNSTVILVGTDSLRYFNSQTLLENIGLLAKTLNAGIIPLPAQNNFNGSILMGSYPEILPGGCPSKGKANISHFNRKWNTKISPFAFHNGHYQIFSKNKFKVVYLIGENPRPSIIGKPKFLIYQNIYPPDDKITADLLLPAAAFTEADGTFINGEGRLQRVKKAVNPPGEAFPDWLILCKIAQKMGKKGFDFSSAKEIHQEIGKEISRFNNFNKPDRKPSAWTIDIKFTNGKKRKADRISLNSRNSFLLAINTDEHTYRGIPLGKWVQGAKTIFRANELQINPVDAKKYGITDGDSVMVNSQKLKKVWSAKISPLLPPGMLHIRLPQEETVDSTPLPVKIRKQNV